MRTRHVLATAALLALPVGIAACSGTTAATSPSAAIASAETDLDAAAIASADAMPLVSMLNGQVPPGTPALVATSTQVLDVMRSGQQIRVYRDVRDSGTRAPIHVHPFGGWTCVVSGTAVLYMEGAEPETAHAGDCIDMPALTPMSNVNPGPGPSVLLDSFATPPNAPVWRIVEPGETQLGDEFATGSATKTND